MSAFDKRRLQESSDLLQEIAKKLKAVTENVVVEKKKPVEKTVIVIHMSTPFEDYDSYYIVDKGLEKEFLKNFGDHCTEWTGYEQFDDAYMPAEFNS